MRIWRTGRYTPNKNSQEFLPGVTSPTWGPPPPCNQVLRLCPQAQIPIFLRPQNFLTRIGLPFTRKMVSPVTATGLQRRFKAPFTRIRIKKMCGYKNGRIRGDMTVEIEGHANTEPLILNCINLGNTLISLHFSCMTNLQRQNCFHINILRSLRFLV